MTGSEETTPTVAVDTALRDLLGARGEVLVKWVLVAEVVDTNGDRVLWTMAPDTAKQWDAIGLMQFALQYEQAKIVRDTMDHDDD